MTTTEMLAPDPYELVAAEQERLDQIKRALLAMSERERLVLLHHDSLGAPLPQLARSLGITGAEAARLLARARRRLSGIPGL